MKKGIKRGKYGEKMIKLAVRFWTNDLPKGTDKKSAWMSGVIYLFKNESKGIRPDKIRFENVKEELMDKLFILLKRNDIKLVKRVKEEFEVINK